MLMKAIRNMCYIASVLVSVDDESEIDVQLLDCVREISVEWQAHFDQIQMNYGMMNQQQEVSFQVATTRATRGPGRPRFNITKEQLEYLSSMFFSWSLLYWACPG